MSKRPAKVIRLNYSKNRPTETMASLSVFGDPAEVRAAVNQRQFMSVNETGISLSPGVGSHINIQALPQNMVYGGMLRDLPFPMSIIPVTPFTPFPNQIIVPPLLGLMPTLVQVASLASLFPGTG